VLKKQQDDPNIINMSIQEQLTAALKDAMKSGDTVRVSAIRMLRADIKNKEIEVKGPLKDADVIALIHKRIKKHKESIDQFEKANRQDLVEQEKKELAVLDPYLPKLLSGAELEKKLQAILDRVGATSAKEMGQVMKAIQTELSGQVDMKEVSQLVKNKLS